MSRTYRAISATTPPLTFHYRTMDIGNNIVGVRGISPKLGDDRVGFHDVVTKIKNGPMGIPRWRRQ